MEVLEIDLGGGCRRIQKQQKDFKSGHFVQARNRWRVIPSGRGEIRYFERTFDFDCPGMSTSFRFRIEFTRPSDAHVDCLASIKRTDPGTGLVDAKLMLVVRHGEHHEVIEKFVFEEMLPGRPDIEYRLKKHVISNKRAQRLCYEDLLVEYDLSVQRCHREQGEVWDLAWAKGDIDTHDSEDSSPKNELCKQSSSYETV